VAEHPLTGDGTFDPAPPPLPADPLGGLVTGSDMPYQRWDEIPMVSGPPAMPDVDEAVVAALAEGPSGRPVPVSHPEPVRHQLPPLRQWPGAAAMARKLRVTKDRPSPEKPVSARTGMSVVIVIVLVTVVLLYYVISSLADTFGKLF
jgi:hypothetical protein